MLIRPTVAMSSADIVYLGIGLQYFITGVLVAIMPICGKYLKSVAIMVDIVCNILNALLRKCRTSFIFLNHRIRALEALRMQFVDEKAR